jgi:regulation of enolase protein 1 (concanavalin A-like superfamily)
MNFDKEKLFLLHQAKDYTIENDKIEIITEPGTDFWQRTYYGFRNDNAPAFLLPVEEKYFSFYVKTEFDSKHRFDQCGVIVYQDSNNWFKASAEYENDRYQRLGSVVTNHGYSDWATTDIKADVKIMYYRLSRRECDFCIETSMDGVTYKQMRIFHLFEGEGIVNIGIYACSPEQSSFKSLFKEIQLTSCHWNEHQ